MLLKNNQNNIGSDLIPFSLKGTDEKNYTDDFFTEEDIPVIIFMCNHCPYVIAVIERLVKLQDKYKSKKVKFLGINPNDPVSYPRDSFENMKIVFNEKKMNFPYLVDDTQEIARKYDAVCTPDIFVFDREKKLTYRGRLDDNWKDESSVTTHDLEDAITAILENKEVSSKQIPSMGCSIKWKQ